MYKTLSAPHILQIEVSSLCPNRCQHCYNFWRKSGGSVAHANLSLDQADRIMDQIINSKVFHIVLTGGEPLLNKAVTFCILERAVTGGVTTSLNSTLVTLTESDAIRLKNLKVSMVLTSLLGPSEEIHDEIAQKKSAFKKTLRGIQILRKVGVPISVNMVISKKNKHLIRETGNLAKSLGVSSFNATRAGCPGNCFDFSGLSLDLKEFRSYLEELHTFGKENGMAVDVLSAYPLCGIKEVNRYQGFSSRRCMAGVNTLAISASGEVRPCTHLDTNYGNLLYEDLNDIWRRMTEWRNGSLIPETCRSCKVLPWCGGGCRMEAKMRNESLCDIDPYASPLDADYVFEQLKSRSKQDEPLPSVVHINPKIRWRLENFGAVVFTGTRFACYLNPEGFRWLQKIPLDVDIPTLDLSERFGKMQEGFIEGLVLRKVLVPSDSKAQERR